MLSTALLAVALSSRVDAVPIADMPNAVRINGEISEAAWQAATAMDGFLQREPEEGGQPSQRTEFRVVYDATTLYVKVRAFDAQADKIVSYLTRRDVDSPSDWLHVFIDSYHDRRTAYEFAVNPSGVKIDRYWFDDNNRDDGWDAVWDAKVSRDAAGWTAEFHIPFSQLRFTPNGANTFGFAVARRIGRLNETSTWPLLARSATGYVSSFGELGGLAMTASPKRLEMVPYTVADLTRQRGGGNPLVKVSSPSGAMGLDLKYALTPGLTLTTTVNPDFGQVEADPAVVNLSAFETFFSERRPFFVEGSGMFRFDSDCMDGPCQLFYSRRIGRSPQGTGELPSGDNIYNQTPTQTTILGAGKLTGRVGKFSIGAMSAVTQEEFGTVLDTTHVFQQPIEPLTTYSIGRVRREFANQSSVGFMVTAANRHLTETTTFLPKSAFTGGVDWDVRFKSRYSVTGYLAGSSVSGSADAIDGIEENSRHYFQRPDATVLHLDQAATSLAGASGRVGVSKIGGQRVRFNSQVGFKSPGFELNDVGFLRRADERWMANWFQVRSDAPNRWFRNRNLNFNQWATWNYSGDRLFAGENVNGNVTFINNWSAGGGINHQPMGFDDRLTRGGPGGFTEGYATIWSWLNSDNRRRVSVNYFRGRGWNGVGSSFADDEIEVTYRPMSALTITSGARLNRSVNDSQWVGKVTDSRDHYAFAHIDQTTVALTERVNYTMTPNLSIQLYAEPFVSAGDYSRFKELANARTRDYGVRYSPYAYDLDANGDPDFNVKSFRTTNVLRWEYKPGSTLFVVWQQARENDAVPGGFRFGRDVRDIFGVTPRNVFLVKLSYWLNY
jgi:uncharacterized protein DUF5916/cellulose/xylan binding protein with CBM9 domain